MLGAAGALAVSMTSGPGASGAASGPPPDALDALFLDWRAFQAPPFRDGVPDYTPAAMAEQQRRLPELQQRLDAIDVAGLPLARQVDAQLVRAEMAGLDFDHRVLRPWERDPSFYAFVVAEQSDVPSREGPAYAGAIETWRHRYPLSAAEASAFAARLRRIPAAVAQARGSLTGDAHDLWLAGVRAQQEQSDALAALSKQVAPHHPELVADVERARKAVDDFRGWLAARLPEKRGPSGVGVSSYDWYLKHVQLSPYTWREELALHERELARARAHLGLTHAGHAGAPPLPTLDTPAEWDRRMGEAVTAYMKFLADRGVGTVEDGMDAALRARVSPFVPPAERDFFAQVDAREPLLMRCHGYHWFDLHRMAQHPHPSAVRRGPLLYNIWASRAEGFATAMEELMTSAGLVDGSPRSRELTYVLIAQRAARGLASLRVHSNEIGLEEAIRLAHEETPYGWLKADGGLVWGEQRLYLEQPGYGTCYLSGKAQIEALLAERAHAQGDGFGLRSFVDEMNASGMIPVSLIRWEMTGRR